MQENKTINNKKQNFKNSYFWVFLYAFIHFLFGIFNISYISWVSNIIRSLYWASLFFYLYKKEQLKNYYICVPNRITCFLLLVVILFSLALGRATININELLNILISVFFEEMAFRILLLKIFTFYLKRTINSSIVISSIIFALFHIVNIFNTTSTIVFIQIIYSFCVGCVLCFLVQQTKSILPSIAIHFLINIMTWNQMLDYKENLFIIISIMFLIYVVTLSKKWSIHS